MLINFSVGVLTSKIKLNYNICIGILISFIIYSVILKYFYRIKEVARIKEIALLYIFGIAKIIMIYNENQWTQFQGFLDFLKSYFKNKVNCEAHFFMLTVKYIFS